MERVERKPWSDQNKLDCFDNGLLVVKLEGCKWVSQSFEVPAIYESVKLGRRTQKIFLE